MTMRSFSFLLIAVSFLNLANAENFTPLQITEGLIQKIETATRANDMNQLFSVMDQSLQVQLCNQPFNYQQFQQNAKATFGQNRRAAVISTTKGLNGVLKGAIGIKDDVLRQSFHLNIEAQNFNGNYKIFRMYFPDFPNCEELKKRAGGKYLRKSKKFPIPWLSVFIPILVEVTGQVLHWTLERQG